MTVVMNICLGLFFFKNLESPVAHRLGYCLLPTVVEALGIKILKLPKPNSAHNWEKKAFVVRPVTLAVKVRQHVWL